LLAGIGPVSIAKPAACHSEKVVRDACDLLIRSRLTFPSVAKITPDLFLVSTSCQVTDPYRGPPKLCHDFPQTPKRAGCPVALRDLKKIQQRLIADALQPVKEVHFAAHAFETQAPRVDVLCRGSFGRF
jgi:hypothetical protein